jgi:hypothetical protein
MIHERGPRIKLKITPKPPEPKPDDACTFVCAACETPTDTHVQSWRTWNEIEKPPICHRCIIYNGTNQQIWVQGMRGEDFDALVRLSAITKILEKEISRGQFYRSAL